MQASSQIFHAGSQPRGHPVRKKTARHYEKTYPASYSLYGMVTLPRCPRIRYSFLFIFVPPRLSHRPSSFEAFLPQAGQQYGHISQSAWNKWQHSPSSARCMMTRCRLQSVSVNIPGTIPISAPRRVREHIEIHIVSLAITLSFKICSESDAIGVKQCELDYGTGVFSRIVIGDEQFGGTACRFHIAARCWTASSCALLPPPDGSKAPVFPTSDKRNFPCMPYSVSAKPLDDQSRLRERRHNIGPHCSRAGRKETPPACRTGG